MADYELMRNGSGYYDETAYKAFVGMMKPGDIWTANDGKEVVLLLHNQGTFCNVLTLFDQSRHSRMVEISSDRPSYTDPGMVKYLFNNKLGRFVQRLPEDEFARVKGMVAETLGFGEQTVNIEIDKRKIAHELLDTILNMAGGL